MTYPKFRKLYEVSGIYVKEGKLVKYRYYNDDIYHEDNHFHHLARQQGSVSENDLELLKGKTNVVIEDNKTVQLFNFDDFRLSEFEKSEEFIRLKDSRFKYTVY